MSADIDLKSDKDCLVYNAPFTQRQSSSCVLTNAGSKRIAIKLRTSDNALFLCNISSALMAPGETKVLHVRCVPFNYEPAKHSNHRLAILYVEASADRATAQEAWKDVKAWHELVVKIEFKNEPAPADAAPADGGADKAPPADGGAAPPAA